MRLDYSVKVQMGPGTSGYAERTEKQRSKKTIWAKFVLECDAIAFAELTKIQHKTWIVTTERATK